MRARRGGRAWPLQHHHPVRPHGRARIASRFPALLATAAVHHHLIRKGLRTSVGLVVETGEAREVHHFACLAGYGAEAINPYLAFETLAAMAERPAREGDRATRPSSASSRRSTRACSRSCRRWASRPTSPIAARRSSTRSGLSRAFVDEFFFGTATRIEGAGLAEIAEETARRHAEAFGDSPVLRSALEVGGEYAYRLRGEAHAWTPETVSLLQHAARGNAKDKYDAFAKLLNEQDEHLLTIRGLFRVRTADEDGRTPVPLDGGRARRLDRQALRHRRDVVRLDLARGAHDARHRDEPHRRQVEHRRRRRGSGPLQARCPTAIRCARRSSRSPRAASA